jgi:hypothetical protein
MAAPTYNPDSVVELARVLASAALEELVRNVVSERKLASLPLADCSAQLTEDSMSGPAS